MARKYITHQTLNTVTDHLTGEIVESTTSKTFRIETTGANFYSVFCELYAFGLTGRDRDVLDYLCTHAQFDKGFVDLNPMARKEMMETLKVSKSQLSNITKNLVKKGIIMTESGRVYINPEFFWKGNLKVRDAIMNNSPISFDVKIDIA
jgi:hypothetical protein